MLEILSSSKWNLQILNLVITPKFNLKSLFFFFNEKAPAIHYIFPRSHGGKLRRSGTFNGRTLENKAILLQNVCKTKFLLISCVNPIIFNMRQLKKNKTIHKNNYLSLYVTAFGLWNYEAIEPFELFRKSLNNKD